MEVLGTARIARWIILDSIQFQPSNLLQVTPDESTGEDYEQVARKYDSEDEFEILW